MIPKPGDPVRLVREASGMAPGSQGVLLGWYATEVRQALISFYDGGPLKVPADAVEPAGQRASEPPG